MLVYEGMDMKRQEIMKRTEQFVRSMLENDASGHDWWHIDRVRKMGLLLGRTENADLFIIEMAALLHDIADEKIIGSEEKGKKIVTNFLQDLPLSEEERIHILHIISTISFKGGNGTKPETLEGQIVQDADRLDALGAIGIARTFMYAGSKGHIMHNPSLPPRKTMSKEQYRNEQGTPINHFYEKLLKLKDLMNTESAKRIAIERHAFMETFLEHFYKEWNDQL